ncbi:MAG TPA: polymer-forming cytoskeletal protein [Polyangiaceae bacterium LLY-WYZ-15_(1-7)]|nr:polymer-forming cytoskeletal protein [Polyangiaceae bacterium LLY-WYZ-15_(1-7)]
MKKASVIPSGVTLVGDIEGDTDLVVFGRVEGPIHVGGALVVEESGVVRGHVRARTVTVRGVLKGDAYGDEAVRVDGGAKLVGDLTAPRVQVVPGARFRGEVHVGSVGEPRLGVYDASLHTFAGVPAPPLTSSGAIDAPAPPTLPGAPSPDAAAAGRDEAPRPLPHAARGAELAPEPPAAEVAPLEPETEPPAAEVASLEPETEPPAVAVAAPEPEREPATEPPEPTTEPAPPRRVALPPLAALRMPRVGRAEGTRRA